MAEVKSGDTPEGSSEQNQSAQVFDDLTALRQAQEELYNEDHIHLSTSNVDTPA